jgi:hypothetical protein
MVHGRYEQHGKEAGPILVASQLINTIMQWTKLPRLVKIRITSMYEALKQFETSRTLFAECVAFLEESLGETSQEVALAIAHMVSANLGDRFWRTKGGILLREEAVRKLEVVFGNNDLRTLVCVGFLARRYSMCGAFKKALKLNEMRVKGLSSTLEERSPWTVAAVDDLTSTRKAIAIRRHFIGGLLNGFCHEYTPARVKRTFEKFALEHVLFNFLCSCRCRGCLLRRGS